MSNPDGPLVDDGLLERTGDGPRLLGSRCRRCATVTFPQQASCPRCTATDVERRRLAARGSLWTWTVQRFEPKSPPYQAGAGEFAPYAVGYVELPGEVRVEARLTEADPQRLRIGMPMELTLIPTPAGDRVTYAFRPAGEAAA